MGKREYKNQRRSSRYDLGIKSVAKFAAASEFDPESEEFNQYLSTVNGDNDFPVSYIPAWKWEKRAEEAELKPEEREFCEQLLAGIPPYRSLFIPRSEADTIFISENLW